MATIARNHFSACILLQVAPNASVEPESPRHTSRSSQAWHEPLRIEHHHENFLITG